MTPKIASALTELPPESLQVTAITYQRVSTEEQASKGGRGEGFSIPAQREANRRKATELGATVVAEFTDPGYSARTINRPDLQRMLAYIKTHQVTYCIVHKVDRLARDRVVDVEIHSALIEAGVTLVSVTESIDESPSGTLVHGVMSAIAEFYSKNLAAEVTKGLTQKIATGGTPTRAPLGYLNVRKHTDEGREYRTVEIDPDRAPLIRWAFETYATGDTTVERILTDITARGLTTVASPKRPAKPVSLSGFYKLLRNPYYTGQIRYNGAIHPGSHEPLVDPETWQRVQRLMSARACAEIRFRKHEHYLKGSLYCASCKSRLQLVHAKNKRGVEYAYYVCMGRARKTTTCTCKAVPVAIAEDLVAACYQQIGINETTYTKLARQVDAAFSERLASRSQELAELTVNRTRLQNESDKLLAAHFADAIDLETLKRHQDRIRAGLAEIDRQLAGESDQHATQRKHLGTALRLLTRCAAMYQQSDDNAKRLANQAFFERIYIGEEVPTTVDLAEPFEALTPAGASHVGCSDKTTRVELRGFEPLTSSMPWKRATNCAIAPGFPAERGRTLPPRGEFRQIVAAGVGSSARDRQGGHLASGLGGQDEGGVAAGDLESHVAGRHFAGGQASGVEFGGGGTRGGIVDLRAHVGEHHESVGDGALIGSDLHPDHQGLVALPGVAEHLPASGAVGGARQREGHAGTGRIGRRGGAGRGGGRAGARPDEHHRKDGGHHHNGERDEPAGTAGTLRRGVGVDVDGAALVGILLRPLLRHAARLPDRSPPHRCRLWMARQPVDHGSRARRRPNCPA